MALKGIDSSFWNICDLLQLVARFYTRTQRLDQAVSYYQQLDEHRQRIMPLVYEIFQMENKAADNAASEMALNLLYRTLSDVSDLIRRVSACLDYDSINRCLRDHLGTIVPFDALYLIRLDGRTQHLLPCAEVQSLPSTPWNQYSLLESCAHMDAPLFLPSVRCAQTQLPPLFEDQDGAVLLMPLLHEQQTMGILCLYRKITAAYSRREAEVLRPLCDCLGTALHTIEMYANALHDAQHDYLTGLYNRNGIYRNESKVFDRHHGKLGVLLLDIDDFKRANDTYGHDIGDQLLCRIAGLVEHLTPDGLVGRYGGEEFLIIIPAQSYDQLKRIGDALVSKIAQEAHVLLNGKRIGVTASVGAYLLEPGEMLSEGIRKADALMYKAKKAGKNCCFCA